MKLLRKNDIGYDNGKIQFDQITFLLVALESVKKIWYRIINLKSNVDPVTFTCFTRRLKSATMHKLLSFFIEK
jgi:hypothetical protein